MKLNLSAKSSRRFRPSLILAILLGITVGLLIPALVPGLGVIAIWILGPIIMAGTFALLVVGFYLIFLNK